MVGEEFLEQVNFYKSAWLPARELVEEAIKKRRQVQGLCAVWHVSRFTVYLPKTSEVSRKQNRSLFLVIWQTGGEWMVGRMTRVCFCFCFSFRQLFLYLPLTLPAFLDRFSVTALTSGRSAVSDVFHISFFPPVFQFSVKLCLQSNSQEKTHNILVHITMSLLDILIQLFICLIFCLIYNYRKNQIKSLLPCIHLISR